MISVSLREAEPESDALPAGNCRAELLHRCAQGGADGCVGAVTAPRWQASLIRPGAVAARAQVLMLRWQRMVGVIIGLVVGGAILALTGRPGARAGGRRGRFSRSATATCANWCSIMNPRPRRSLRPFIVTSWARWTATCAFTSSVPTARRSMTSSPPLARSECRVSPILAGHPITTWSRDRWVALGPAAAGGATTLWSPRGEAGDEIWPARAGDERVGRDIAAALAPAVLARRSGLYFDGGDFLADSDTVFVVPRVLQRNIQQTVSSREEFLGDPVPRTQAPGRSCSTRRPTIMRGCSWPRWVTEPMLVGDPSLARELVAAEMAAG